MEQQTFISPQETFQLLQKIQEKIQKEVNAIQSINMLIELEIVNKDSIDFEKISDIMDKNQKKLQNIKNNFL